MDVSAVSGVCCVVSGRREMKMSAHVDRRKKLWLCQIGLTMAGFVWET